MLSSDDEEEAGYSRHMPEISMSSTDMTQHDFPYPEPIDFDAELAKG
jgi:hypothetical protein